MTALIDILSQNWNVIRQAPFAFFSAIAVAGTAGFIVARQWKAEQIDTLKGRLALKDDQLADYQRQLEGATPEEASARIASLEAELALLRPRSISPQQKSDIISAIKGTHADLLIGVNGTSSDAYSFGIELREAFSDGGWTTDINMFVSAWVNQSPTGIRLVAGDRNALNEGEAAAARALEAANLPYDLLHFGMPIENERVHIEISTPHKLTQKLAQKDK